MAVDDVVDVVDEETDDEPPQPVRTAAAPNTLPPMKCRRFIFTVPCPSGSAHVVSVTIGPVWVERGAFRQIDASIQHAWPTTPGVVLTSAELTMRMLGDPAFPFLTSKTLMPTLLADAVAGGSWAASLALL